jgi:hypothetical protein
MESSYAKGIKPNSVAVKPHKKGHSLLHVQVYMAILSSMAEEGLPDANQRWNLGNISDLLEMLKVDSNLPSPLRGFPASCLLLLLLLPK